MKKLYLLVALFLFSNLASAADLTIDMLNKRDDGKRMVYSLEVAKVDAGQSIKWVAKDKGHNVEMIKGPDGASLPKKSKLNEDVTIKFDTPGIYLYKCTPHVGMGMIGLVVVGGDTSNKDAIMKVKLGGKSKKKRKTLLSDL
ncbi:MAG: pseudoazurin [Rickettsiales bacterium]|nr:pseudoazurin [Rickettsiales bacterium]